MKKQFDILKITRANILKEIEELSAAALFKIPSGFNNNIIWNTMHVIASQQLLMYGLSQTPFRIDKEIIMAFKSGTTPTEEIKPELIQFAKNHLLTTPTQLEEDYQNQIFGDAFKSVTLSYGMTLNNLEDAIYFNNIHEAMHLGQIKMLKQCIKI
ncbi:MAG: DinB family protein [Bacteroidota bacterium]